MDLKKGIEVGHIFKLGTKYSEPMKTKITDENSKYSPVHMGCYGIGVTRIVAAAIEQNNDSRGIIWPDSLSPFEAVIIDIDSGQDIQVQKFAESLYQDLYNNNVDVIYDDRDIGFGNKVKDWELIGVPNLIIIGKKEAASDCVTYKSRDKVEKTMIELNELRSRIIKN